MVNIEKKKKKVKRNISHTLNRSSVGMKELATEKNLDNRTGSFSLKP